MENLGNQYRLEVSAKVPSRCGYVTLSNGLPKDMYVYILVANYTLRCSVTKEVKGAASNNKS